MYTFSLPYGRTQIQVSIPYEVTVKGMGKAEVIADENAAIQAALRQPVACAPLETIARQKKKDNPLANAVIVVSDNTRPVPYRGEKGILTPIISGLLQGGFLEEEITVLIGAGSHRNMEPEEYELMLGLKAADFHNVQVANHEYDNEAQLQFLGYTRRGSKVAINKQYWEASLKIVTGLVESHFMAGASGGRKGICPGIVGIETLEIFHGAALLSSSQAADLVLEGNPLSDESLEIALMAGCDFLVNVTIDAEKRLTGVFAGDLVKAHQAAVSKIREYVVVPLEKTYDLVVIPGGFVGINHYQLGKAAIEAARALKQGGCIVLVAHNTDTDPIGGFGYKQALALLEKLGVVGFLSAIAAPDWKMVQEQWQVQMWCKVLQRTGGAEHIWYCGLEIPVVDYWGLPNMPGLSLLTAEEQNLPPLEAMPLMVSRAIEKAVEQLGISNPEILVLKDGPYGIPEVIQPN